jgi:hypothetical protein
MMKDPTAMNQVIPEPMVTDQNAAHRPRPNAMGSAPNSMFP